MVDQEIVKYIREQMKNGFEIDEIRNFLVLEGYYPADDVDEAVSFIKGENAVQHQIRPGPLTKEEENEIEPFKKKTSKLMMAIYAAITIMGILVVLKLLSYFEIIDIFVLIGTDDPFTMIGRALNLSG